jgi:hypothetical protein
MPKQRPKVFVANRSAHDYSAAERYGDLVYVTAGQQNRFAANNHARLWMEALRDSSSHDYIILSSMNIICGIGCALFAMMHGRLNFLMYRRGKYIKRELVLSDMLSAEGLEVPWAEELGENQEEDNA